MIIIIIRVAKRLMTAFVDVQVVWRAEALQITGLVQIIYVDLLIYYHWKVGIIQAYI